MLTLDEDREISALAAGGWSISAIARRLGHDRKTIRAHLYGDRSARRRRSARDGFEPFVGYVRERLAKHPDGPARLLYRELVARGFTLSYPTLTARLRALRLGPPKSHDVTQPAATAVHGVEAQNRDRAQLPADITVVADGPPQLTPGAARVLLCILLKAADRSNDRTGRFHSAR